MKWRHISKKCAMQWFIASFQYVPPVAENSVSLLHNLLSFLAFPSPTPTSSMLERVQVSNGWSDKANLRFFVLFVLFLFHLLILLPLPLLLLSFLFFCFSVSHFCFLWVHMAGYYRNHTVTLWSCQCRWFPKSIPHRVSYCIPVGFGNLVVSGSLFSRIPKNTWWVWNPVSCISQSVSYPI